MHHSNAYIIDLLGSPILIGRNFYSESCLISLISLLSLVGLELSGIRYPREYAVGLRDSPRTNIRDRRIRTKEKE